jgi:hypothetical protein
MCLGWHSVQQGQQAWYVGWRPCFDKWTFTFRTACGAPQQHGMVQYSKPATSRRPTAAAA